MAFIVPHSLRPGLAPHPFFVRAKIKTLQKSKIVAPQTDAEREAFVEGPAKEAFEAALAEKQPEAYALSAAEKVRLARVGHLKDLMAQDKRSVAAFEFFITEADAAIPNQRPEETLFVEFHYDLSSDLDALAQAYEAAKADPRFAGATQA